MPEHKLWWTIFLTVLLSCNACAANSKCLAGSDQPGVGVSVVAIGWHTGLVLPQAALSGELAALKGLHQSELLEVGWGDRQYYMASDPSLFTLLSAALWPTEGVLQVQAYEGDPSLRFGKEQSVELKLSTDSFQRLLDYINESFVTDGESGAVPLAQGHYLNSRFYSATGAFSILNTCNTWAARGLAQAGCALGWPLPVTASGFLKDLRKLSQPPRYPGAKTSTD